VSLLILVVDDESDVEMLFRQQFRRDLRAGRFTMDFAQSADSALQRISDTAGASLILILSDINMPGMSGLELLPKAKAARPDVPVIMITAYGDAETRRKALEGGAEALLTKPIDLICFAMKSTAVLQGPRDRRLRSLGLQIQATKCSMSALPSTAEIYQGDGHVRFVPKHISGSEPHLIDHLVGDRQCVRRNGEAQRLGRLHVDDQLEFVRRLNRQVARR